MSKIDIETELRALGERYRQEIEEWCDSPEGRAQNERVIARVIAASAAQEAIMIKYRVYDRMIHAWRTDGGIRWDDTYMPRPPSLDSYDAVGRLVRDVMGDDEVAVIADAPMWQTAPSSFDFGVAA
jgi:hypothetical protein